MIDLDDFREELEALDAAEERMKRGVAPLREFPANQTAAIVRAGVFWREEAYRLSKIIGETQKRIAENMGVSASSEAGQ